MKILVTGAAGFIGFHTTSRLAISEHEITALDNINSYYDTSLKFDRLSLLGLPKDAIRPATPLTSDRYPNLRFIQLGLEDKKGLLDLFQTSSFDIVINLAAQAGVRYSLQDPDAYIASNISGFFNILEACRAFPVTRLIYASSSSVYGLNEKIPFSPEDKTDRPISLYAATKKSNELMAHTYRHLFNIPVSGLRFFTVYGPWGRPDMAYYSFTKNILAGKEIQVYNHGDQMRDFTFIDDIVEGILRLMDNAINHPGRLQHPVYNLGNNQPVKLIEFIEILESLLHKQAVKKFVPGQPGDVTVTYADISASQNDFDYQPSTGIKDGLARFTEWFLSYYKD